MLVLNDLDLTKLCQLKNTLMQRATVPPAQGNADFGTLGDSNVGLFCHYDGKVWYWGKTLAGPAQWLSLMTTTDLPAYADPNRMVVTNASRQPVSSLDFGVDVNRNLDFGVSGTRRRIINLEDPIDDYDGANKRYVDSLVSGLTDFKDSCVLATVTDTGGTLVVNPGGLILDDVDAGVLDAMAEPLEVGMRVLVKDEVDAQYNGIYGIIAISGYNLTLQRTQDANQTGDLSDGTFVFVERGTAHGRTAWVITDSGTTPVLNTDPINWVLFSSTGGVQAGAGLIAIGDVIHVNPDNVTIHLPANLVAVKGATVNDRVLLTNTGGPAVTPVWGQIDLSAGRTFVTGILPPANGGVGINISTALQGALLYTPSNNVWGVLNTPSSGSSLQVLTTDTGSRNIRWVDTTGGGTTVMLNSNPVLVIGLRTNDTGIFLFERWAGGSPNLNEIQLGTGDGGGLGLATIGLGTLLGLGRGSCSGRLFDNLGASGSNTIAIANVNLGNTGALSLTIGRGGNGATNRIFFGDTGVNSQIQMQSNVLCFQLLEVQAGNVRFNGGGSYLTFSLPALYAPVVWTSQDTGGTVAYLENKISDFGSVTSAELAAVITDETGSASGGLAVFSNSPTFLNAVLPGTTTFAVFNTGATTVNAFGAATTLNLGNATAGQTVGICTAATATSTYNLFTGAVASANTKTVNLGGGGAAGSTTNISIGPAAGQGTGTVTIGTGSTLVATSPVIHTSLLSGTAAFDLFANTVSTLAFAGSALSVAMFSNASVSAQTVGICTSTSGGGNLNLFTAPTGNGNTLTIRLGTGGVSGSTTVIQLGSGNAGAVGSVDFRLACLVFDSNTVNSFQVRNATDSTKRFTFNAAIISTGQTRILTVKDRNGTIALVEDGLGQFVIPNSLTSAQLASILTDETGSGLAVFGTSPTIVTGRLTDPYVTGHLRDASGNRIIALSATEDGTWWTMAGSNNLAGSLSLGIGGVTSTQNTSILLAPRQSGAVPSAWGYAGWTDTAANASARTLRMCRTWGMTLSTGALDRANNALAVGATMTIAHEFGTQDVMVLVNEVSSGSMVLVDWRKTAGQETRQVTLSFKTAPSSGAYRITVIG
jgi:hypothetical protein